MPFIKENCHALWVILGHIPRPLPEQNVLAEKFTQLIALSQLELAQWSHALHHQNGKSLRKQFGLTREIACQIVKQCDGCP